MTISTPGMGWDGFLQFGAETTYANSATATKRLSYVMPVRLMGSNGIDPSRFLDDSGRDLGTNLIGNHNEPFAFTCAASDFALLKYVTGTVETTGTYIHTLTPADTIKSFTLHGGIDATADLSWKLNGCKIAQYVLSGEEGKRWTEQFNIIASWPETNTTVTALSAATVRPFEWDDAKIEWSYTGTTYTELTNVSALSIVYQNGLIPRRYLGTDAEIPKGCLNALITGPRAYGIRLVKDFTNLDEFKQFMGGAAYTSPQKTPFVGKLKLTLTRSATDNVVITFGALMIDSPGWTQAPNVPQLYDLSIVGQTLTNIVVTNTTATYW